MAEEEIKPEKKRCKVHGTILKEENVPVSYGLPIFDESVFEAGDKLFPNSKRNVIGGCVVGSMGDRTDVLVCPECRTAETDWRKENKKENKIGKIIL